MAKTVAEDIRLSDSGRWTTGVPAQFNSPRIIRIGLKKGR